jgi:translation initiation factor 1A
MLKRLIDLVYTGINMPKKSKGGKNKRRGKNESLSKRELVFKEDGQEYAQVTRMLGNGRLEAYCFDGQKRQCHIRGQMKRRVWINNDDIILIGLRDYQDEKADVILKYTPDEVRALKEYGELPDNLKVNENDDDPNTEIIFLKMNDVPESNSEDSDDPSNI